MVMSHYRFSWIMFGMLAWVSSSAAYAEIVYSSLAQGGDSIGYINGSADYEEDSMIGKGISLDDENGAIISSATFLVNNVSWGDGPGTFELSFYEINPGEDEDYLTGDDLLGAQIGTTFSEDNISLATDETFTLSGFSYQVPQHFAWVLTAASSNLSFLLETSGTAIGTGGSSNPDYLWWNIDSVSGTAPLETGSSVGLWYDSIPAMQFEGATVPVPEPATMALLIAGGVAAVAAYRRHMRG